MADWLQRHSSCCLWRTPNLSCKVWFVQPALVEVQNPLSISEQGQHVHSILLTKHKATLWIALNWHLSWHTITKSKIILHNRLHLQHWKWEIFLALDCFNYHLSIHNRHTIGKHVLYHSFHGLFGLLGLLFLDPQLNVLLGLLLCFLDQLADQSRRYLEVLGDVALVDVIIQVHTNNGLSSGKGYLLQMAFLAGLGNSSISISSILNLWLK